MEARAVTHTTRTNAVAALRKTGFSLTRSARRQWRTKTAALRPLPSFIIIGAQRSGTTSLYNWITQHPDVAPASQKELHYFDGSNYDRGERWYRSQFPIVSGRRRSCESTPQMLYNPVSPKYVAKDLPSSTKFVVLLRDPVERALSHYWLSRKNGAETEEIVTAFALERERLAREDEAFRAGRYSYAHHKFSYVARGDYATQLARWFSCVDRDRMLVLESERLFSDQDRRLTLTSWLGLDPLSAPIPSLNSAPRSEIPLELISRLKEHFEPRNRQLFEMLGHPLWGQ
ncbi:MAG: sulfotransferase [Acidimicrobiales bacterium]|jgi:hypothetical protein